MRFFRVFVSTVLLLSCFVQGQVYAQAPMLKDGVTLVTDDGYVIEDYGAPHLADIGSSTPVVFDWNYDGLQDLIIGRNSTYNSISLYLNEGTAENPVLHFVEFLGTTNGVAFEVTPHPG